MKPCWKVIQGSAINMNNVQGMYMKYDNELHVTMICDLDMSKGYCFYYEKEAERDEAFEYLMRDDEAEAFQQRSNLEDKAHAEYMLEKRRLEREK